MAVTTFLGPYDIAPILDGALQAMEVKRPNWLQSFFPAPQYSDRTRVNLDQEYNIKNVMGQFVAPTADATPIKLNDFGTKELYFAYSKEAITSDDFDTLNQRQFGQQFGQVDVLANKAARLTQKVTLAEYRFENLFEKTAADIFLYGGYQASGENHPIVRYDFNRTVIKTVSDLNTKKLIPSVNLTASAVTAPWDSSTTVLPVLTGGTAGARAWSKAKVDDKSCTPVLDVVRIYETANARSGSSAVVMSDDAYDVFNYDLLKNYSLASDTTIQAIVRVSQDILPRAQQYKGLTYRRSYPLDNGAIINIYTYNAVYNDRITGVETSYIGSGWVLSLPSAENALKIYGRIMHPRANWQAMPRWMNYWMNDKTGQEEWEYHTNFLMAHKDIDSVVAWKVI